LNLTFDSKYKGKILFVNQDVVYRAYKNCIYKSVDSGSSWKRVINYSIKDPLKKICYQFQITRRLLRLGVHHFIPDYDYSGLVYDKSFALLKDGVLIESAPLKGSRPLSLEKIGQDFLFGEYRSNPERSDIKIWQFGINKMLKPVFKLAGIRHIHGIYRDPYTNKLWITTGDNDDECAIYCTNDKFDRMVKVYFGSQQARAIKLLFTKEDIYFGSDTPEEVNYLYRMNRKSRTVSQLQKVGSSVFHGCKVGSWLFFSTAIEPSLINKTRMAEVWASPDGTKWRRIFTFKKDVLPMRYFQYGQVFFPNGPSDNSNLWLSPFGTRYDNQSIKVSLDLINEIYWKSL
jgi:hypothetical protein